MDRILGVGFLLLICALGARAQDVNCTSEPPPCGESAICIDALEGPECLCENGTYLGSDNECYVNCTSEPPPCGESAICVETSEGPECLCENGTYMGSNNECYDCFHGTWGMNCSLSCDCTDDTVTCDPVNGTCPSMCYSSPCGEGAECIGNSSTYMCVCPAGYQLMNETYCLECEWNTWGVECSENCSCVDNATTCNPVTGVCPEDEPNCASSPCSGENVACMDISLGVFRCYCTNGSMLANDTHCMRCPAGTWGANCTQTCDCGANGNGCNNVNGDCECNSCWSGPKCMTGEDSDCVYDFLMEVDKCESSLRERYGGSDYPQPPPNTLTPLTVTLMDLDNAVVIQDPVFSSVDRNDVDQGPLVSLTWTVDKNQDRPNAEGGLDSLVELVKLGEVRGTLIVNDKEDTAEVTINAGVRRCEEEEEEN